MDMNSSTSISSNDVTKRLKALLQENEGYEFIKCNGQRIYKPLSSLELNDPPNGCEVFIGNLPRTVFEDELIPLFQKIGKLYKFRLMLDFNGRTRGFAFATYFNSYNANKSIELLNGYELRKDTSIGVFKSVDNRRLYIGNIPKNKTLEEIQQTFQSVFDDLKKVHVYPNWRDKKTNCRFIFLEFANHAVASNTRRQYFPKGLFLWGRRLFVDWADPIPEIDPSIMCQIKILYLTNLPIYVSQMEMFKFLDNLTNSRIVRKVRKMGNYAFVHCFTRHDAEILMEKLTGTVLYDQIIEVHWARPRQYNKQSQNMMVNVNHFCLSVSASYRQIVRQNSPKYRTSMTRANDSHSSFGSSERSWTDQ